MNRLSIMNNIAVLTSTVGPTWVSLNSTLSKVANIAIAIPMIIGAFIIISNASSILNLITGKDRQTDPQEAEKAKTALKRGLIFLLVPLILRTLIPMLAPGIVDGTTWYFVGEGSNYILNMGN